MESHPTAFLFSQVSPRGLYWAPLCFWCTYDLPSSVDCNVSLFADGTLIYQEVNNESDQKRFQNNIDGLSLWAANWKMPFNASKCQVIGFGQHHTSVPKYRLDNANITCVQETKYLGITIQGDLKFNNHIGNKVK